MPNHNKRLLIQLDKAMKEINRDTLNPLFKEITPADMLPVMELVAAARGEYLQELINLSQIPKENQRLNTDFVKALRFKWLIYEELLQAPQSLDKTIEHGYLDVES